MMAEHDRNLNTTRNIAMTHRMRIKVIREGYVTLEYTGPETGERITRDFSCPRISDQYGGYVMERDDHGDWKHVCHRLYNRGGWTLTVSTAAELPDVIRREYHAMRKAEARADQNG